MKRLHKFLNLSSSDRQFLISTFVLLGFIRLGLWLLPFKTFRKFLSKIDCVVLKFQSDAQINLNKIVWAVNLSTGHMPGGAKCLVRALTTRILMARYKYSSTLRIGVMKDEEGLFEAHAWVEDAQGRVVIGHLYNLTSYILMPTFEGL